MNAKFVLNQQNNYNADFGKVFRSASTFYYINSNKKNIRTTISFMDYWSIKNNLEVKILANVREMSGELIFREELYFKDGNVINYSPFIKDEFEGSIEIEILSLENLRFPYPAIMVYYKGTSQSTMTHTYGRVYSPHEIEDKKTIPFGHETGWTIRDKKELKSFCIFHNGSDCCDEQIMIIDISTEGSKEKKRIPFKLRKLMPYETIKIYAEDFFPEIKSYLDGKSGNIALNFKLKNAFTRLLVGHESTQDGSLQVTHSNFNYNKIQTDIVQDSKAVFIVPNLKFSNFNMIVYPGRTQGNYKIKTSTTSISLKNNDIIKFTIKPMERLEFSSDDNTIPSRIVIGLEYGDNDIYLSELSSNIFHNKKPAKRFHWGNLIPDSLGSSKLIFTDLKELFGGIKENNPITIRFYSSKTKDILERKFPASNFKILEKEGFDLSNDQEIKNFINGDIGWWSIFCEYGGLYPFILVQDNINKTYTLEHAF